MSNFIRGAIVWVEIQIGLKKAEHVKKNKPLWRGRIEGDINRLRQEASFLDLFKNLRENWD